MRTVNTTDDSQARERALDIGRHVLVQAPAGSGKTALLVQRGLACLAASDNPEEVLLVTFTNKAANEIRERMLSAIRDADAPADGDHEHKLRALAKAVAARAREKSWGLLENPARLRAMTIDSLNGFLAQSAPLLSGLGGSSNVEQSPENIYRDAVLALFNQLDSLEESDPLKGALKTVLRIGSNRIERLMGFLCDMLARRDQWLPILAQLQADPDRWGEVTGEIVTKLVAARRWRAAEIMGGDCMREFAQAAHQAGLLANNLWPSASEEAGAETWRALCKLLLTQQGTLRKRYTVREKFPAGQPYTTAANQVLARFGASPSLAQLEDALGDVARLPAGSELTEVMEQNRAVGRVLWNLAAHLALSFQQAGALDFQEVAVRALTALNGGDGHTALLERMDYAIRHILVDEAQDTSVSQYALLSAMTLGWQPGDGRSLFMVGDPQQSIYGFRQAEVRLFLELWESHRFNELDLDCLQLTQNFRSAPAVVDWCNRVFSSVFPAVNDADSDAVAYVAAGAARTDAGKVVEHWFTGEPQAEEAASAVAAVKAAIEKNPDSSIAVLVRARPHVREIIRAFDAAGISYACQDIDPLSETDAVRDVAALVRALWHDHDRVAWGTMLRAPFVGLSYADLVAVCCGRTSGSFQDAITAALAEDRLSAEGRTRLERLSNSLAAVHKDRALAFNLPDMAEAMWHGLGGPACVTETEAENVRSTFALLREHTTGGRLEDLDGFLTGLKKLYAAPGTGRVQILTVHKAKGLEFDTVILAGLWRRGPKDDAPLLAYRHSRDGALVVAAPGFRAAESHEGLYQTVNDLVSRARQNEDRRVLYVAATRARTTLHVMLVASAGATPVAPSSSAMTLLWPAVGAGYQPSPTVGGTGHDRQAFQPLSPRLPAAWCTPDVTLAYLPPVSPVLMPSELVVREALDVEGREDGVYDRIVGILVHEVLADICQRKAQADPRLAERYEPALPARMRRLGMPEPRLVEGTARVLGLARGTLASKDGQWVTAPRSVEENEYRLAGFHNGRWVSAVLDRVFEDGNALVVADYKTGGRELEGGALEAFVDRQVAQYRPQVEEYARLLGAERRRPVRAGLFFTEAQRWVEVVAGPPDVGF